MKNMLGTPLIILVNIVLGCSSEGTKTNVPINQAKDVYQSPTAAPDVEIRRVPINQTKVFNGIEIMVASVLIEKNNVVVTMKIKNITDKTISVYPDQGSIVVGTHQLDANVFESEGDVSGEIYPGVEKIGAILFKDKMGGIDPNLVNQIDLRLGEFYDSKYKKTEIKWTLNLP